MRTTLPELLDLRQGVCQDFTHLALGCLRAVGLPARYVSGYLETAPPPGQPRLEGSDASHAWASVMVPGGGWVDLDPTNDHLADSRYVVTAWGRDFRDVSPLKGVVFTEAERLVPGRRGRRGAAAVPGRARLRSPDGLRRPFSAALGG